jgi:purine-cytosine permease-like protein
MSNVAMVAGIAGRDSFSAILSNLLGILGYWTAFFIVIVAIEHFIFRREDGRLGGYNLDDYDNADKLPIGIACVAAIFFGAVGAIVGMSQFYYEGPIGRLAGGADIGLELSAAFSAIVYPTVRWWEIRKYGR